MTHISARLRPLKSEAKPYRPEISRQALIGSASRRVFPSRRINLSASFSSREPQTPQPPSLPGPHLPGHPHDAMLAFTPSSSPHAFLPAIASPLSPRSANIHGPTRHPFKVMSAEQNAPETPRFTFDKSSLNTSTSPATTTPKSHVPFSQRSIKRAPSPKQNELTERRRSAFLRKVQDGREDRRYEMRGEDIMRLDFVRRRREEEQRLAMSAPTPSAEEGEDEAELPGWAEMDVSCSSQVQEGDVEEFVRDEEEEMMALLENMPDDQEMEGSDGSENLWSDDADYDALFSEVLRKEEQAGLSQGGGGEEMDMS